MKRHTLLFTSLVCFSFCCLAQAKYSKDAFMDSLKTAVYLKNYFEKHTEYNDSSYALYMNSILPIDTFEIDSNSGYGYNPTSIAIVYDSSSYLNFYCGLGVYKEKNNTIKELCFYNHNGQKTALSWRFYKNENIQKINYYLPELMDTAKHLGKVISKKPSYSFRKFRKSGSLELSGVIINGKKNGEWFYYDSKGILFKKETFNENKRVNKVSF